MTNSSNTQPQPDKTNETYAISNNEFLKAIYGDLPDSIRGMIVSSKGNPNKKTKGFWNAEPWTADKQTPKNHNNYFTVSTFKPDKNGKHKRQKQLFHSTHAIMLDDIGTKIPLDRLTIEPSWIIETSPGNYQFGIILDEPIADEKVADNLMKSIIDAGLCDPGAGGPCARLARLPVAVNGKHDPEFQCSLTKWQPDMKYSIDEIAKGLSLDTRNTAHKKVKVGHAEQIYIPRPSENPIISVLKSRGLYKKEIDESKHDITCPWVDEHTDSIDGGSAYFIPDDLYPIGGFKCHHGHCAERNIHNLLENLSIDAARARVKPIIRAISGEMHNIVDLAEQELAKVGKYYQRGGLIVTIVKDKTTQETIIKDIRQNAMPPILSRCSTWEGYDGRSKSLVIKDPPQRVISALMDAPEYKHLPVLKGLAHQPHLSPEGSIINKSGYHPETGMYGVFLEKDFNISDTPTKKNAEDALQTILGLLNEFPFADEADGAAALSAILTATVRTSLPLAPMYHVRAPQISSGKSFLCEIISKFASSAIPTSSPFPQNDEECRKHILSVLLRAPAVVSFDNLTNDIVAYDTFCAILTSTQLTDRILGVSKTTTVSTRTLFLSNGNNVGPLQDMARRCNVINLDPACEIPAARTFNNPNVLKELSDNRALYVSAALTIIKAWITSGKPKADCKTIASYTEWSDYCRQPLLWLGLPDPASNMFKTMSDDPERETLGQVLTLWDELFGNTPKMVRDIINCISEPDFDGPASDLKELIEDIALDKHTINRRRFGSWIKRNANKIVGGMKFVRYEGKLSAAAWRVEKV